MRREDAAAYADYIDRTGMAEYRSTPGNQGAWMLRRDDGDRSEIIVSLWDSGTASGRSLARTSSKPSSIRRTTASSSNVMSRCVTTRSSVDFLGRHLGGAR